MNVEIQRVNIEGHLLHRMIMHPPEGVPLRAAAIFYHGQGDYAERYSQVLSPFTKRGIRCVVTDLPGHGYSPGRRGHSGDEALLDALILDTLESFDGLPYGVMGHSMGGLLAARHLVLAGKGKFPAPVFGWMNAPLLRPSHGRSKAFLTMLRAVATLFPELTMSTGVKPAMCRVQEDVGEEKNDKMASKQEKPEKHPLWHGRISMGWGMVLFKAESLIWESVGDIASDIPLLLSQGSADPVCPPEYARAFFEHLPQEASSYHEFKDGLHELFSAEGDDRLQRMLSEWLDRVMPF